MGEDKGSEISVAGSEARKLEPCRVPAPSSFALCLVNLSYIFPVPLAVLLQVQQPATSTKRLRMDTCSVCFVQPCRSAEADCASVLPAGPSHPRLK